MDFLVYALIPLGITIFYCVWKFINSTKLSKLSFPPGPIGLPILGNAAQIGKLPHETFSSWADKYGDIYRVKLGWVNAIVINEPNLLREVFSQSTDCTGRMNSVCIHDAFDKADKPHGIINTEGAEWQDLRRFTMKTLRDFGVGKKSMELHINKEVDKVIQKLEDFEGNPVLDLHSVFRLPVIGSLWTILCGERMTGGSEESYNKLGESIDGAFKQMAEKGGILYLAPWFRHVAPNWSGFTAFRNMMGNLRTIFDALVKHHQTQTGARNSVGFDEKRNFIDIFLQHISKTVDSESAFFQDNGEKQLIATLIDFFMAGTDTTTSFFLWATFLLGKHPGVQEKLRMEIDSVEKDVDGGRITLEHVKRMPYTEAVISEVHRFGSVLPLGVPHKALVNTTFGQYRVSKGSVVFGNLYYIHHSQKIWGDPEVFRPERFLIQKGGDDAITCQNHPALVPFSTGRRQCLGEGLAKTSIFLFMTRIFQNFEVRVGGDFEDVVKGVVGVTLQPKHFLATFTKIE